MAAAWPLGYEVSDHHVCIADSLNVDGMDPLPVDEDVFISCRCTDGTHVSSVYWSYDIGEMHHLIKCLLGGSHCVIVSWKCDKSWC